MTVRVRLSGDPAEIEQLIAVLREEFDIAGGDQYYPNRGAFGVRAYLELRTTAEPKTEEAPRRVRTERVRPKRKEIEP